MFAQRHDKRNWYIFKEDNSVKIDLLPFKKVYVFPLKAKSFLSE